MADLDVAHRRGLVVAASPAPVTLSNALRWALGVAVIAGAVRLVVAGLTPLFPDETYYWEWSRHLAAGYFDHPPLIAWAIRFGTLVGGNTPLGVRLGPVIAGTAGTLFLIAAAHRIGGDRASLWAAAIFAAMPLSAAGLVLATPDAPLFCAIAAALYALIRALEQPPRSRASFRWWCVSGAAVGLALCAKYTAVLFPLGVFVALLSRRAHRVRLAEPGPWVASAVALVVFSPVVLWNAQHEWISFAFQLQHGLGAVGGSPLKREIEMIGGQLGLVSPILFVMCVVAVIRSIRTPISVVQSSLAVIGVVIFAFFMYSATKRRVEANWPALAYLPAILLVVGYAGTRNWDRWLRGGIVLGGALSATAYVNAFTPILPVPARRDPAARASGWDDLASAVNKVYSGRRAISSYRTFVAADRYQEASTLAFHLPGHPATFSLNLSGRANHYDLWPTFPRTARTRDAMILVVDAVEGAHPAVTALTPHFTTVTAGETVTLARDGDPVKYLRIWLLGGWRGTWPSGGIRSRT